MEIVKIMNQIKSVECILNLNINKWDRSELIKFSMNEEIKDLREGMFNIKEYESLAFSSGLSVIHMLCLNFDKITEELLIEIIDKCEDLDILTEDKCAPIHYACKFANENIIMYMINKGANINLVTNSGDNVIQLLSIRRMNQIIELIFERGDNINLETKLKIKTIHIACETCNLELLNYLLEKKCSVNEADEDGKRPIHYACIASNFKIVKFLFNKGAYLGLPTISGFTPLYLACKYPNLEIVKFLVSKDVDINHQCFENKTPLHMAYSNKNNDIFFFLMSCKEIIPKFKTINGIIKLTTGPPLYSPLINNHYDIINCDYLYFESRFSGGFGYQSGECDGYDKLQNGIIKLLTVESYQMINHRKTRSNILYSILERLRTNKVDFIDFMESKLLNIILTYSKNLTREIIKYIIDNTPNLEKILIYNGKELAFKAIHFACEYCDDEIIVHMLTRGVDINVKSKYDINLKSKYNDVYSGTVTPLNILCLYNKINMIKLFVEIGADINTANSCGLKPIHLLCISSTPEIIDLFFNLGVDLETKDNQGSSPIHYACEFGNNQVIKYLVDKKVKLSEPNNNGDYPLTFPSYRCNLGIVKYLIDAGAENVAVNRIKYYYNKLFGISQKEYPKSFKINEDDLVQIKVK